jgi:hypothetical protein
LILKLAVVDIRLIQAITRMDGKVKSGNPVDIATGHFPNTILELHRCPQFGKD